MVSGFPDDCPRTNWPREREHKRRTRIRGYKWPTGWTGESLVNHLRKLQTHNLTITQREKTILCMNLLSFSSGLITTFHI